MLRAPTQSTKICSKNSRSKRQFSMNLWSQKQSNRRIIDRKTELAAPLPLNNCPRSDKRLRNESIHNTFNPPFCHDGCAKHSGIPFAPPLTFTEESSGKTHKKIHRKLQRDARYEFLTCADLGRVAWKIPGWTPTIKIRSGTQNENRKVSQS